MVSYDSYGKLIEQKGVKMERLKIILTAIAVSFPVLCYALEPTEGTVGQLQFARHVSTLRDIAEITYPNIAEKTDSVPKPRTLLLTEPRHFDYDGVYIWRDPEGIWNIHCFGKRPIALSGTVLGAQALEQIGTSAGEVEVLQKSNDTLTISTLTELTSGTMQFKATGPYVDFDLLLNGKRDTTCIYLGAQCKNPKHVPFRIENRPVTVLREKSRVIAKSNVSTQTVPKNASPTQEKSKTSKQSPTMHGGGGRSERD